MKKQKFIILALAAGLLLIAIMSYTGNDSRQADSILDYFKGDESEEFKIEMAGIYGTDALLDLKAENIDDEGFIGELTAILEDIKVYPLSIFYLSDTFQPDYYDSYHIVLQTNNDELINFDIIDKNHIVYQTTTFKIESSPDLVEIYNLLVRYGYAH